MTTQVVWLYLLTWVSKKWCVLRYYKDTSPTCWVCSQLPQLLFGRATPQAACPPLLLQELLHPRCTFAFAFSELPNISVSLLCWGPSELALSSNYEHSPNFVSFPKMTKVCSVSMSMSPVKALSSIGPQEYHLYLTATQTNYQPFETDQLRSSQFCKHLQPVCPGHIFPIWPQGYYVRLCWKL